MPIINGRYQTPSAFGYGVNDRRSIQDRLRKSISQRPPASLSRQAPPTETDRGETPSLLRNPKYDNLPSAAFGQGQNPERWQQVRNDQIAKANADRASQANTNTGIASNDQSRTPQDYIMSRTREDGTYSKIPNDAPDLIKREEPSQVVSQNAAIAARNATRTPQQIDAARTGTPPPLFAPERRTTGTSDQMRVATDWANKGSSPGEIAQRMKTVASMKNDDFGRRTPTVSPAAQAAEQQRKTAFNDWDSGRSGNPKGTPLTNQQLGIADNNDAVSAKVGFDVASSQDRTSQVLRQSQRAEELANKSRNTATRLNSEKSSGLFS